MPTHDDATAFSKTCKRCRGRSELVATIWDGGYEVYRCLMCNFIDWVPRVTQGHTLRGTQRTPSAQERRLTEARRYR